MRRASAAVINHYKAVFGLDGGLLTQYGHFMSQLILHRNFGPSLLEYPTPAQDVVAHALPWTIGLLFTSAVIAWILGTLLGAFAGWRRNSRISEVATWFSVGLGQIPFYFIGLVTVFLLAYKLTIFPPGAPYSANVHQGFNLPFIGSVLDHAILPAFSIIFVTVLGTMLGMRQQMVTVLGEDYLTFAQAKGLPPEADPHPLRHGQLLPSADHRPGDLLWVYFCRQRAGGGAVPVPRGGLHPGQGHRRPRPQHGDVRHGPGHIRRPDLCLHPRPDNAVARPPHQVHTMSATPMEQPGRGALPVSVIRTTGATAGGYRAIRDSPLRFRNALRTLRSRKKLTAGLIVLLFVILVGVFSGEICNLIGQGQNPISIGFGPRFAPSTWATPLGTDEYGRDILALTVTGLWTSLKVGFYAGVLSTLIGVTIAFFAAYRGGLVDSTLRTVTDTFLVVPALPLLIAFTGFAKNVSLFEVALILAVFGWAFAARPIRSQVLSLRTRGYVDLAKVSRLNTVEIVFEELVPNMLPYIILGLSFAVIGAIFALISLEIIGLGPTNLIDLGLLINSAISSGALDAGGVAALRGPDHCHRAAVRGAKPHQYRSRRSVQPQAATGGGRVK